MDDRTHAPPPAQAEPVLLAAAADGVVTLTLNRPHQYNALSAALVAALQRALDAIAADASVRVVMITGAGAAFCSGHDLREMRAMDSPAAVEALFTACSTMMQSLVALPQPVIAVVNGLATAAGCQLVAQCDLAVASERARFAASGVNLGLFCSTPAVAISRNLGRKRAAEMLFTGEFIDAATALDWGLVNRVATAQQLLECAQGLAAALKAKPRDTLALGKALFYRQLDDPLRAAYADASRTIAANLHGEAAREGIDAFIEKRAPRWEA
jgi:enoyl-CoA hydratase/carnithine racemase